MPRASPVQLLFGSLAAVIPSEGTSVRDAEDVHKLFVDQWMREVRQNPKKPSLKRALWRTFKKPILQSAACKAIWGALIVLSASYFVRQLLTFLNNYNPIAGEKKDVGWILSAFFFLCCWLLSIALQQVSRIGGALGLDVRSAVATTIYRKALTVDTSESHADVLSLVSTDCQKLCEGIANINFLWSGVAEAIAIMGVLVGLVGWPALPGFGLLILVLPFQYAMGLLAAKLRKRTVMASEQRVRLMDEVLRSAKLVKCYAWEESFAALVAAYRGRETDIQRFSGIVKSINLMIVFVLPPLMGLLIFGIISIDSDLQSVTAFTTLSLFNTLRLPLVQLPKCLRSAAEALAAVERVQAFLLEPDRQVTVRSDVVGVHMQNASFCYGVASNAPLLRNITLDIRPGQLVMICGRVGSGKSNLMQAILGNMTQVGGSFTAGGRFAYVPQQPWCQFGTVRENILFGQPWDEARYRAVVHACSLTRDFEIMEQGDLTEIGERGINVSGGQKARIALARAAYSTADMHMLDSPLSAVDTFVATHITRHLFKTWLRGKTIVLITHALELLYLADTVVIMDQGMPAYAGPYNTEAIKGFFGDIATVTPDTDVHIEQATIVATEETRAAIEAIEARKQQSDGSLPGAGEEDVSIPSTPMVPPHDVDSKNPATIATVRSVSFADDDDKGDVIRTQRSASDGNSFLQASGRFLAAAEVLSNVADNDSSVILRAAYNKRVSVIKALEGAGMLVTSGHDVPAASADQPARSRQPSDAIGSLPLRQSSLVAKSAAPSVPATPSVGQVQAKGADTVDLGVVVSVSDVPDAMQTMLSRKVQQAAVSSAGASPTVAVAAMGVPAVIDRHRPVRPERKEKSFNGYSVLFKEMKHVLVAISFTIFIITQLTRIFSDLWISSWVTRKYGREESWYVAQYAAYVGMFLGLLFIRGAFFYTIFRRAASRMHNKMFKSILRAPLYWFTVTPIGRVLSTFSRDQDSIDEALPDAMMMVTIYFMILCTTVGLVIRVLPFFAAVAGVLLISFAWFMRKYIKASRMMKTQAGESLSLQVAHVSETLQGLAVVRAFEAEGRFALDNLRKTQSVQSTGFNLDMLQIWLSFRLDTTCCLLVLGVCLLCIGLAEDVKAASAGLAISNAFQILLFFSLMVRGAAEIDSNISSAERIQQLARVLPEPDIPLDHESCPHASWPHRGELTFSNVHMSYAPSLPRVLKGVSFNIKPCEKIGIVGRTGAGKSSLLMALFRLAELSEGSIEIDGIDIGVLNLRELRSRIAILPQEPVLFEGTLRSNVDPFNRYTDEELLAVAEKCYLNGVIAASGKGLQMPISHGGSNVSLGTAQLVCLARALLNKSRILVLDEATAALDLETDRAVQGVIRKEFADRTILTIAHRLDTIIDSDRILVMNAGQVAEFDTPLSLLENPASIFHSLCHQAGARQYDELLHAARRHQRVLHALATEVEAEMALVETQAADTLVGIAQSTDVAISRQPSQSSLIEVDASDVTMALEARISRRLRDMSTAGI